MSFWSINLVMMAPPVDCLVLLYTIYGTAQLQGNVCLRVTHEKLESNTQET